MSYVKSQAAFMRYFSIFLTIIFSSTFLSISSVLAQPLLNVVAAENMYGDIARQLGGNRVVVNDILSSPDQDPHLFEISPQIARMINKADIIIVNGAGYDSWIGHMINKKGGRRKAIVITASELLNWPKGGNPHLWYGVKTIRVVANAIYQAYRDTDPKYANDFDNRLKSFLKEIDRIDSRIHCLYPMTSKLKVAMTEPVFGLMAEQLGMISKENRYQLAIMNSVEPSPAVIAQFEQDLKQKVVDMLVYNNQVTDISTVRLKNIALTSKIPVIGVTETMPKSLHYQDWIMKELDAVEHSLNIKSCQP